MTVPTVLKVSLSAPLFGFGLLFSGWHDAVLDHYSVNCTMLPDPAPYPPELLRLAGGQLSLEGVRELLTCESKPLSTWKSVTKARIILGTATR
jgi:hypothetical protein